MRYTKKLENWFLKSPARLGSSKKSPWYLVMWLTGVDYFSSVAYQAGIALLAAGILAPVATGILVLVTLFCCVPVYFEVSRRSFAGLGSIAMLENLLSGWWGKLFVLILLGFAGTDFVITMTLSAADAARHATENPYLHPFLGHAHMRITIFLLILLAVIFINGFHEAIILAALVAVPYLALNIAVVIRALIHIIHHPEMLANWRIALFAHNSLRHIITSAILIFPGLALGLSGFETGVSVMPLISCTDKKAAAIPEGRIRNTRKLLVTAALIMSFLLLGSSFVTTLLIPEADYREGGIASGRAMAYLAHQLLGNIFGSVYDISTIAILWFAGASAMAGLLNLIPRYLPRFGMAPEWTQHSRPLILVLLIINLAVTFVFKANVDKQAGAYATGVLALILSATIAAALVLWQEFKAGKTLGKFGLSVFYSLAVIVFGYTLTVNIGERPDGIIIAAIFIILLILVSILSRYRRATELRVGGCVFMDGESEMLWNEMQKQAVNLVPINNLSLPKINAKAAAIEKVYNVEGPVAFLKTNLLDNRSDFLEELKVKVSKKSGHYLIEIFQANVVANTVAYLATKLQPRAVFLGLTRRNLMNQSLRFFFSGIGETGLLVYEILVRYWQDKPAGNRPMLFLMSD